jgi:fatty acid desaturase
MASLPPWSNRPQHRVDEPFSSDPDFWTAMAASADAFIALVIAAGIAVALALMVSGPWSLVAFVLPLPLLVRAAQVGRASSRRTKLAYASREDWRDSERQAVARSFGAALCRRRVH